MQRLSQTFDNFSRKMSSGALDPNIFARRTSLMNSAFADANRSISGLIKTASVAPAVGGWNSFTRAILGLGSASLLVQGHFGGFSTRFFGLAGMIREFGPSMAIATAGIVGFAGGLALLAEHALHSGMALQGMQLQFRAVSGSVAVATHDLQFVHDVAMQAGVSILHLGPAYAKFNAAAAESGLTMKQTEMVSRDVTLAGATMQ